MIIIILCALLVGGVAAWQYSTLQKKGEVLPEAKPSAQVTSEDETTNWKTYRNEEEGFEFKYPEKLDTKYLGIHSPDWPPKVSIAPIDPDFVCEEIEPSPAGSQKEVMINDTTYCVFSIGSPTAGSTYVEFKYITNKDDKQLTLEFTLVYSHCGLYYGDDNKMEKCKEEQGKFSVDTLTDQILSTFRFIE